MYHRFANFISLAMHSKTWFMKQLMSFICRCCCCCFGGSYKHHCLYLYLEAFSLFLYAYSSHFMVWSLTFTSSIHFYICEYRALLIKLFLLWCMFFVSFLRISLTINMFSFLVSLVLHGSMSVLIALPCCLAYYSALICLNIRCWDISNFVLTLILIFLWFLVYFAIALVVTWRMSLLL